MKVRTFRKRSAGWALLGIVAAVALAGLVFIGCGTGGGGGNQHAVTLNFYDV